MQSLMDDESVSLESIVAYKKDIFSASDAEARIKEIDMEVATLKSQLLASENASIETQEQRVALLSAIIGKMNELYHQIDPDTIPTADNVGGVVSKAEMLDIYESKFVKGTGRPYYDKYMSLPTNGKCPFCGIGTVSTLDHYLPKSKYPALAITPKNMIPACRDCNLGKKRTFSPQNSEEEPLHPYFDDVEQDIWLSVRFEVAGKELVPTYFVRKPVAWNDLLFRRVENHMVLYNLYTSYAVHAAEEITGRSGIWHVFLDRCGEDFLAASFHDEAVSRELCTVPNALNKFIRFGQ